MHFQSVHFTELIPADTISKEKEFVMKEGMVNYRPCTERLRKVRAEISAQLKTLTVCGNSIPALDLNQPRFKHAQ